MPGLALMMAFFVDFFALFSILFWGHHTKYSRSPAATQIFTWFVIIFFYFQFIQESMSCANQSHRYERWTTKFSRESDQKGLNRL